MTKIAKAQTFSTQTPVRRVGLSKLTKNLTVNVVNHVGNTLPEAKNNFGRKIGINSPIREMQRLIDGSSVSADANKTDSNTTESKSNKKETSYNKSLTKYEKIINKSPSPWKLKTSTEESSPLKPESGQKVGLSPWKQAEYAEKTPVKFGNVKRKIDMEESPLANSSGTNKYQRKGKSPWKHLENDNFGMTSPMKCGSPCSPRRIGLKSPANCQSVPPSPVPGPVTPRKDDSPVIILESSIESDNSDEPVVNEPEKEVGPSMPLIDSQTSANPPLAQDLSEEKENPNAIHVEMPSSLFRSVSRPLSQLSNNIHGDLKTFPEDAKANKHKRKYRLSLTITPERLVELRKRKLELTNNDATPKRQNHEWKSKNFRPIIDLTQDSDDDDDDDVIEVPVSLPVIASDQEIKPKFATPVVLTTQQPVTNRDEKNILELKSQVEEKRQKLKSLKVLKESNEQTKRLIKQWTEGGIRALQELSETRSPPLEIQLILDRLQIPHEMYGYDAAMDSFDPKFP